MGVGSPGAGVTCKQGHLLSVSWTMLDHSQPSAREKSVRIECPICRHEFTAVIDGRADPASVQVECHPYFPQWELLDFCRENGIVVQAGAPLAHASSPRIVDDPVIKGVAERIDKTPAQVALAWAVQRGTAFLTTSTKPHNIQASFDISTLPEDAMREIRDGINTHVRFNTVVKTGVPGFIPQGR